MASVAPVALHAPVDRLCHGRGRTAFEREALPGFTRWVIERVRHLEPDYLVPVETKGARLLEAALAYADDELGEPLGVPLIYGTALAYMSPEELAAGRFLIVDDAIHTGTNLRRHRERLERYGARDIGALAFMSYANGAATARKVESYREVDVRLYHEYLWQLAELVIARGLPPEVDHQVFTLRGPGRLPIAWQRLRAGLTRFGTLNVDGPVSRDDDELLAMTLHFPQLPGARRYPTEGDIRNEGANKIRFFPDVATGRIVVVPVSFPTLDLPSGTVETEPLPDAAARVRGWAGHDDGIAELLVESVRTADPEAVFRMLSACTEVELMRGLARALPAIFPEGGVSIASQRVPLARLYGRDIGDLVAARVDGELRAAAEAGEHEPAEALSRLTPQPPVFLEPRIADATQHVVDGLRDLYERRTADEDFDRTRRVGRTLSEIIDEAPNKDPLLASRCVGYGLAMTSLVPYVQILRRADGSLSVRREYRLSERDTGDDEGAGSQAYASLQRYPNINGRHQSLSEQAVALIATFVKMKVPGYADQPVPLSLVSYLVAILQPLVLAAEEDIKLHVVPGEHEPTILLDHDTQRLELSDVTSSFFALCDVPRSERGVTTTEHAIEPTEAFRQMFDAGHADIQMCNSSERIESWLERLVPLIAELDDSAQQRLLAPWAMSTDRRLGLTHVLANLHEALAMLERPLNLILRRQCHARSRGVARRAEHLTTQAGAKADMLKRDWSEPVRDLFAEPLTRARKIRSSLGAPSGCGSFGKLSFALIDLSSALCGPVDRLDEMSVAAWQDGEDRVDVEDLMTILRWCGRIDDALTSLGSDNLAEPIVPSGHAGTYATARELKRTLELIEELAAATAGAYRGAKGKRVAPPDDLRASTVLSLDIADSLAFTLGNPQQSTVAWKDAGLNIAAQWGMALGGWEGRDRQGDLVWLEFADRGDPAVIAAAAVQQHMQALRSTGNHDESWGFRCAVDDGDLQGSDGSNTHGQCLDRASRLAKVRKDEADSIERVLLAQEAANRCSSPVVERLTTPFADNVAIVEGDPEAIVVRPLELDTAAVLDELAARATEIATEISQAMPAPPEGESLATELIDEHAGADDEGESGESPSA